MVSAAVPLMVAVVANYRPYQTIITTNERTNKHTHTQRSLDIWTHTCYPPYGSHFFSAVHHRHTHAHTHTLADWLTHSHSVFRQGFFIHFPKKSTLTLKLAYGLPTLLLLYVFPLEAITAETTVLAPTAPHKVLSLLVKKLCCSCQVCIVYSSKQVRWYLGQWKRLGKFFSLLFLLHVYHI